MQIDERLRRRGAPTRRRRPELPSPPGPRATVPELVQPRLGASMMASTIAKSAPATSNVPTMSSDRDAPAPPSRGRCGSTPARASTTSGMFTRKTLPHQKCDRRKPPSVGPITMPDAGDSRPCRDRLWPLTRVGRLRSGSTGSPASTNAAPKPITTRSAISTPALGAKEAARLPRAKTTSPPMSERRRPIAVAEGSGRDQQRSEAQACRRPRSTATSSCRRAAPWRASGERY